MINKEKSNLRENIEAILIAIIIAMFIRSFIVQAFKIPSGSMENTLLIGDHILVNKFIYGVKLPFINKTIIPFKNPKNGDIVVFTFELDPDKKDYIKRVIGIAGDAIEIRDKKVYVNGKITEQYPAIFSDEKTYPENVNPRDNLGLVTVPENSLFVMGDNRDNSYDSRFWGFVNLKSLKGRAFMIYWSWDSTSFGVRWKRIGDTIK
ncbi:MAG: signal peptidase I [Proteobacteria bacterium]|nr:signal peptidase I [Pseudomonadota bacterium]MBU4470248.1 signal peptidase I [Pseudomonadota bacterium]MCG2752663.1 signal peptidase I [Desulfobacteraceae bacterium]